jgi:hypothetical protein
MANLLPAVAEPIAAGRLRVVVDAEHAFELDSPLAGPTPIWIGIRAEGLKLDDGRGGGIALGKGRVQQVASDGVLCTVRIEWAGHAVRTQLLSGRSLARALAAGQSVALSVRPEDVHLMPRGAPARAER